MIAEVENNGMSDFALLLRFDMGIDDFSSDWAYCDRLSSYMARMVSHNRSDSVLYSNLLSSALNELLETVFRCHQGGGEFTCAISRKGVRDRVELTIPVDSTASRFYYDAVAGVSAPDAAEQYRNALFSEGPLPASLGLLELAVDYTARFSIEALGEGSLRLLAELALEE